MKLLIFTSRCHPQEGGVEKVVEFIAQALSKDNTVKILASKAEGVGLLNLTDAEINHNKVCIKRIWFGLPRSLGGLLIFPIRFILSFALIYRYVNEFKPDIINYHFPDDSSIYFYFLTLFTKYKFVVNLHGNDLQVFRNKFPHKFFIDRVVNKADKVVVNSTYMESEFIKVYPDLKTKVTIIPNAIDLNKIKRIKGRKFFSTPYIFFVGRLVHKKGVDFLLEAFAKANVKDLNMLIEGNGEEYEKIKSLRDKLGLQDRVVLSKGRLTHEEKFSYMKEAEFGVMPSRIEPFGIVSIEFMAAQVPLIATNTGGLKTLIKHNQNGYLVEVDDVDALSKAIVLMHTDAVLRQKLSSNAYKFVKKYDLENITDLYKDLFKSSI